MLHNPTTAKGAFSWAVFGFGAAIVALLVAHIFPNVIPAKAASQQL